MWRPQMKSASWNTGSAGITPSFISFILIFRSRNPSSAMLVFVTLACDENTILRRVSCNFYQSHRSVISYCACFCAGPKYFSFGFSGSHLNVFDKYDKFPYFRRDNLKIKFHRVFCLATSGRIRSFSSQFLRYITEEFRVRAS